eukprot:TRINITY_DN4419_c1_g1_i1.p1 TRINITY_DN4419_c1_g1~~TRINITY_DN4419_c1_g1_i1.p1  ORF type:complete len:517 (+),score=301.09 TRINITY_DN4419_c1_g1_i1:61-1611(+)
MSGKDWDAFDADGELKIINAMLDKQEGGEDKVNDALGTKVGDFQMFLDFHGERLRDLKNARKKHVALEKDNEKLVSEIGELKVAIDEEKHVKISELMKEIKALRDPISKQCERERLFRQEEDAANPFKLIKAVHEVTRDREAEILIATKQLRELRMILAMMKQHEAQFEVESAAQVAEKIKEKDRDIHNVAQRCLTERAHLLEEVKRVKDDIDEMHEKLRTGHYENKEKKAQKLRDYQARVQAEFEDGGVEATFDQAKGGAEANEEGSPVRRSVDRSYVVLEKKNAADPAGLKFEDKTRLIAVEPGSHADKCGFGQYIGRRVIAVGGEPVRPGQGLKIQGKKTVTLRFDLDVEGLRCSYLKRDVDDPEHQFAVKSDKYKGDYKRMEIETDTLRQKARLEKTNVTEQEKALKKYEQDMAKDKREREREIMRMQNKLAVVRDQIGDLEAEGGRLYSWMDNNRKTLDVLKVKNKEHTKLLASEEKKQIEAPPAQDEEEAEEAPAAEEAPVEEAEAETAA